MSRSASLRLSHTPLDLVKHPKFLLSTGAIIVACSGIEVVGIVANSGATTPARIAPAAVHSSESAAIVAAPLPASAMKDGWYEGVAPVVVVAPALSAQPRDAWYLDPPPFSSVPPLSSQARDTWYRDR
jgi:hypothetical protein